MADDAAQKQGSGVEGLLSASTSSAVPNSQSPGHPSFRSEKAESVNDQSANEDLADLSPSNRNTQVFNSQDGIPAATLSDEMAAQQANESNTYAAYMKPKFARAPITEAGRVAYLGESSNLSLLVHDYHGTTDVVHYPLPDTVRGSRARLNELDDIEINILNQRGAFLLPPRSLCDELVDSYFTWVAPVVPIINRTRFMRRYRDTENPPSLLLLQAVLLAGSRVCTNRQLMDANGSTTPAAMTFYKRAKALYDANYEDDRVTIVQALTLMGWYWEGPEDVTKNVFYWSRVATIVAQGSGMHRSVENSQLSRADKRLWKRIWWTLFTRDRSVAVALGRPVHINTSDSDVEMISEDDFIDDESDQRSDYPADPINVQFFLQYVKLCEIMGLVLSQQYSVAKKNRPGTAIDLTHSDMALADWVQNCPKEVRHEHRDSITEQEKYPSRNIAFQAAGAITSIVEQLSEHKQLRYCPAFILFSALIMHVYQMRSSQPQVVATSQARLQRCMNALSEVSKVWLVAKMVHVLFKSILGNQVLTDRMQKAAGKRHLKGNSNGASQPRHESVKRKFDDMDIGFQNGLPAAQVSYERSRPQTPAPPASRDLPVQLPTSMAAPPTSTAGPSPPYRGPIQGGDAFMGGPGGISRPETRPPTPFNPSSYTIPATPPDLYLVTRNSPPISQSLYENFQPDQLFPEGTGANIAVPMFSPGLAQSAPGPLDPQLAGVGGIPGLSPQQQQQQLANQMQMGQGSPLQGLNMPLGFQFAPTVGYDATQGMGQGMDLGSPDETWSNSSKVGAVPNTLNVEDW
ncbi:MAG: Transcriptional activator of fatty acid utilization [Vezdaea aestivalis]|nr:MAG: Transcriptional activator of fatty acid utilization [Vezdaea aestivalis]